MQLPNNALTSKLLAVAVQAITVVQSGAKAIGDAITSLHLPEKVVTSQIFRVGVQAAVAATTVTGLAGVAVGSVAGISAAFGAVGLAALSPFVPAIGGVAAIAVAGAVGGYFASRLLVDSNAAPASSMLIKTGIAAGACGVAAALIGVAGFIFAPPIAIAAAIAAGLGEAGVAGAAVGSVVVERVGYVPMPHNQLEAA
jgi:hypothetical protein